MTAWEKDAATARPPGGETVQELQYRAGTALGRFWALHTEETVVVVSHLFTILSVVAKVLDMPLQNFLRIRLDRAAIVKIDFAPAKSEVISTNERWHLRP